MSLHAAQRDLDRQRSFPQPHRRTIDTSQLSAAEWDELAAMVRRLRMAGGFTPRLLRLTLSPSEIDRCSALMQMVFWRAVGLQDAPHDAKGVEMPSVHAVALRRTTALSDLEDAALHAAQLLGITTPAQIDPKRDSIWDGALRLEQIASLLNAIVAVLEAAPVAAQGA